MISTFLAVTIANLPIIILDLSPGWLTFRPTVGWETLSLPPPSSSTPTYLVCQQPPTQHRHTFSLVNNKYEVFNKNKRKYIQN